MESNEKFTGVSYVIDLLLKPETFYEDMFGTFHIGPGTDLHRRLFELSMTQTDLRWLKALKINPFK
jgi:hypothetical protein